MSAKKRKQGTPTEKSFEAVKEFVVAKFPDFANITLFACDEADEMYEESIVEQAQEGKPPRVYAHVGHFDDMVCYTLHMDNLPEGQRQGIFVHEFGHLYAKRYPYNAETDEYFEWEEDSDADLVVVTIFEVNLHYGEDDDIEYVVLPIGSEQIENIEASDEEIEQTLEKLEEKYGVEEDEEEEEASEFDLGLPSAEELRDSISDTFRKMPVIDTEFESVERENEKKKEREME